MIYGREFELAALGEAYARMLRGNGNVLVLTGEAGLGKTTLVHTWWSAVKEQHRLEAISDNGNDGSESETHQSETLFLESCCSTPIGVTEVGRLEALQPWIEISSALVNHLRAGGNEPAQKRKRKFDVSKFMIDTAPSWVTMIPILGPSVGAALEILGAGYDQVYIAKRMEAVHHDASQAPNQQLLFQQFAGLLRVVSANTPLVLFIDDLHWADASTCNLLFSLSREIESLRVLILVSMRPEEATRAADRSAHASVRVLSELMRYGVGQELSLRTLSIDAVADLVRALLSELRADLPLPDPTFVRWLHTISDGNALFVTQFLKALHDEQMFDDQGRFVGDYSKIPIPSSAAAVVEQRARQMEPKVRELLAIATVEGVQFSLYLLQHLAKKDALELLEVLQRAASSGFVRELAEESRIGDHASAGFRFSHALLHRALYGQLLGAMRQYLHRACFDLLKREWDDAPDKRRAVQSVASGMLAHAEQCGEWRALAEVALVAAQEHWKNGSTSETMELANNGISALARLGSQSTDEHLIEAELRLVRAEVFTFQGRVSDAIADLAVARQLFGALNQPRRVIDGINATAAAYLANSRLDEGAAECRTALNEAESIDYAAGKAAALLGLARFALVRGAYMEGHDYLQRSLPIHYANGDVIAEAITRRYIGMAVQAVGEVDEALKHFEYSLELFRSRQNRLGMSHALESISSVHLGRGDLNRAMTEAEESYRNAETIGSLIAMSAAMMIWGSAEVQSGRHEAGMQRLVKSEALAHQSGFLYGHANSLCELGKMHAHLGDHTRAVEYLRRGLELRIRMDNRLGIVRTRSLIAHSLQQLDKLDEASAELTSALDLASMTNEPVHIATVSMDLAQVEAVRGDTARSRTLLLESIRLFRELQRVEHVRRCEEQLARLM